MEDGGAGGGGGDCIGGGVNTEDGDEDKTKASRIGSVQLDMVITTVASCSQGQN